MQKHPIRPLRGGQAASPAKAAVALRRQGLRPVPLTPVGTPIHRHGSGTTESDGKDPIGRDWATRTYANAEELRAVYRQHPGAGVGLALGLAPDGGPGLIDLEVDDPGVAAGTLTAIFGAAGPPRTAGWTSARGEHRGYMLEPADATRLLAAGVASAVLDGRRHPCLAGVELRLGTLDPDDPKQTQSVVPPTVTRNPDGSLSLPRRYVDADAGYVRIPAQLLDYVVAHLGARPKSAAVMIIPDRSGLVGLTPLEKFTAQLAKMGIKWSKCGEGSSCRCPAHRGDSANCTFREADDDRLLVHCHRGCSFDEIIKSVNLTPWDAHFAGGERRAPRAGGPRASNIEEIREITEEQRAKIAYMHERARAALAAKPEKFQALVDQLGVASEALKTLDIGWREDVGRVDGRWVGTGTWAWIFPEVDGHEEIVGLLRRYEDPARAKKLVSGGRRGLTVPVGWRDMPGPIYLVKGATDVAALLTIGVCAVGRPNNKSGAADLAVLLKGDARAITVIGERDQKPDGDWPGDPRPFARELARRLGRAIAHQLPPAPHKDVREFVNSQLSLKA